MPDPITTPDVPPVDPAAPPADPPVDGQEALGDPGKRALDAMKAERNAAKAEAATVKAAMEALQAQIAGKQAEHEANLAAQKVKDEALATANQRILKAEIRALATGKLADPADALLYINPSSFEVGDDGATDAAAIAAAVDNLIKARPYLAAAQAPKFGSADAGVRNGTAPNLATQIAEAQKAGQHTLVIALKRQLAASQNTN